MAALRRKKPAKGLARVMWMALGFFLAGYLPTVIFQNPIFGVGLAAGLMVPAGSRAKTVKIGLLKGLGYGLVTGLSAMSAMSFVVQQAIESRQADANQVTTAPAEANETTTRPAGDIPAGEPNATPPTTAPATQPADANYPPLPSARTLTYLYVYTVCLAVIICVPLGGLFAHLAKKRRQRIDQMWDEA